ncbi:NAD-dependent protein deacetylase hst1 [Exophiala dermatitidis]
MSSSAPHSPTAYRGSDADSKRSPSRQSPSKLARMNQLGAERASSMPADRLSSPFADVLQIRPRLNQYYTIDHAVSLFKTCKNIVVLTGAGISTSLGVPDFRSSNGVYALLKDSIYDDPQELFHIDNFKANPEEFFKQAAKVFPKMQGVTPEGGSGGPGRSTSQVPTVPRYSSTHAFIAMLQSKGKLLTNYTQNIDGLETAAGISSSKLIQVHGTLATATCMSCGKKTTARKYMPVAQAGDIPVCKCSLIKEPKETQHRGRSGAGKKKRKRYEFEDSDSDSEESTKSFRKGLLKPDMTFFGEHISYSYAPRLEEDRDKIDLLVIIGTSLKVAPVNEMLTAIPPTVPQIWISKDRCQRQGVKVDIELLGECDVVVEEIALRAGWTSALEDRMWQRQAFSDKKNPTAPSKKAQPQVKQEDRGRAPVKPQENLQFRPKTDAKDDQTEGRKSELKSDGNAGDRPVMDGKAVNGKAIKSEEPTNGTDGKARSSAKPKVIVELEEGTMSRWYIRRAK